MGSKLYEKLSQSKYKNAFALFLFNEAQHMDNFEVGHRRIKTLKDIQTANDHVAIDEIKQIEYDYIEYDVKPWGELLPGGIVGESDRMKMIWERTLRPFSRSESVNSLLIKSKPGAGGTQTSEAIREMMGIGEWGKRAVRLSCADLLSMSEDEIRDMFFGKTFPESPSFGIEKQSFGDKGVLKYLTDLAKEQGADGRSLLVIDDLSYAASKREKAETIRAILHFILEDSKRVGLQTGEILDISNIKIVGITNDEKLRGFSMSLSERFNLKVTIPDLGERGDDILRMAERINFDESKEIGIPYSAFDENVSGYIKSWVEKSKGKIQARDLKNFVINTILAREYLLKKFYKGEKFPETTTDGKSIFTGIGVNPKDDEEYNIKTKEQIEKIFSPYLITIVDLLHGITPTKNSIKDSTLTLTKISQKYAPNFRKTNTEPLCAYFKERFQPKDPQGNFTSFYTGPIGQQPGMTMIRQGNKDMGDNLEEKFPKFGKILEEISDIYDDYGVDYKSLAEALREAPLVAELGSLETGDVVEYMDKFFKKVFGGKCEVKTKYDQSKKDQTTIETDITVDNSRYVPGEIADGLDQERDAKCEKCQFRVVFERTVKKDTESLSVAIKFPFEKKKTEYTRFSTVSMTPKKVTDIMQDIAADMLGNKRIPEGVRNIVAANVVDFSKLDEKSALIFSETAVFDKGLGLFLAKLSRAGINVAVVAPADWQKDAIDSLNKREKAKIVCLDSVGHAFEAMPADSYYYFKTKDDPDWGETRGIIQCDITDKIAIIIRALAAANHVTDVGEIEYMEQLADQFRQAV